MADGEQHKPDEKTYLESTYHDWRCIICCQLAIRPSVLEYQHLFSYGPFKDVNGKYWFKCDTCSKPFHLECLQIPANTPPGRWECVICRVGDDSDEGKPKILSFLFKYKK
jgi:hypothetical protein